MNFMDEAPTETALVPVAAPAALATAPRPITRKLLSLGEALEVGRVLAKSGFFPDAREENRACAKILFGQELGLDPVTSLKDIYVLESKAGPKFAVSVHVLTGLVKRSGRYDYRVKDRSAKRCEVEFFEVRWSHDDKGWPSKDLLPLGSSVFTHEDAIVAELAGQPNYRKWPANMLFARAAADGVRRFCPDVLFGALYASEELDQRPVDLPQPSQPSQPSQPRTQVPTVGVAVVTPPITLHTPPPPVEPSPPSPPSQAEENLDQTAAALGLAPGTHDLAPDGPATAEETLLVDGLQLPLARARSLIRRICALKPDDALDATDARDVNAYLKEILPGDGAKAAWKAALGDVPKPSKPGGGVRVTKEQVLRLASYLLPT